MKGLLVTTDQKEITLLLSRIGNPLSLTKNHIGQIYFWKAFGGVLDYCSEAKELGYEIMWQGEK